jgi:hypothetical protein
MPCSHFGGVDFLGGLIMLWISFAFTDAFFNGGFHDLGKPLPRTDEE